MAAGTTRIALQLETGDAAGEITRGSEHVHVPADALEAATRALSAAAARDTRLVAMTPETVTRIDLLDDRGARRPAARRRRVDVLDAEARRTRPTRALSTNGWRASAPSGPRRARTVPTRVT